MLGSGKVTPVRGTTLLGRGRGILGRGIAMLCRGMAMHGRGSAMLGHQNCSFKAIAWQCLAVAQLWYAAAEICLATE